MSDRFFSWITRRETVPNEEYQGDASAIYLGDVYMVVFYRMDGCVVRVCVCCVWMVVCIVMELLEES